MNVKTHPFQRKTTEEVTVTVEDGNITSPEDMTPEQRAELARLVQEHPESGQVLVRQLADKGYALTIDGRIVKVRKSTLRDAAAEGEDAGEQALENVKEFFSATGENIALYGYALPKEGLSNVGEWFGEKRENASIRADRLVNEHQTKRAARKAKRQAKKAEKAEALAAKFSAEAAKHRQEAVEAANEHDSLPPV